MSRTEDTTGNGKNIGGIGRNRGPRAGSDLSGGVTRVEGEKGLETAPRASIPDRLLGAFSRAVGDPVERIKDCKIEPPVGLVHGDTLVLNLNGIMGTPPDVIECLGQRYVHEERVEEARQSGEAARLPSLTARIEQLSRELQEANAKVAELSKVRVFNVAGLVEKDLAERYESLVESFATLQADIIDRNHELAEARALIAESAPVVRFVETVANLTDTECDFLDGFDLRSTARENFAERDSWRNTHDPRTYTDEQRAEAALAIFGRWYENDREFYAARVDLGAVKLGMRRAK